MVESNGVSKYSIITILLLYNIFGTWKIVERNLQSPAGSNHFGTSRKKRNDPNSMNNILLVVNVIRCPRPRRFVFQTIVLTKFDLLL